jgi:transcriptional regulator with XRE-family HTH domain
VISWTQIVPIGKDEKAFFMQLGARIASLRKEHGITQVQMAELLEVSQQTINAYEVGRRYMPVSSLPVIARYLGVFIEELIGSCRVRRREERTDTQYPAADGAQPAPAQGPAALRHADDRYRARSAGSLTISS